MTNYKLVPVEPTQTMIRAGQTGITTTCAIAVYQSMLAAAPQPAGEPIGEMRDTGVYWFRGNPHSFPVGTKFYTSQPAASAEQEPAGWLKTREGKVKWNLNVGVEIGAALYTHAAPALPDKAEQEPVADYWLIFFDDCDRKPEVFTDEYVARQRYEAVSSSWNAHLFAKVDSNSRDYTRAAPCPKCEEWVPLNISFDEGETSEEVAYGTQRMMDRLKKWLDKFYAQKTKLAALEAELQRAEKVIENFEKAFSGSHLSIKYAKTVIDEYRKEVK